MMPDKNAHSHRARSSAWRKNNPEKHRAQQARSRRRRAPQDMLKFRLKARYGLTVEDYNALFEEQGQRCAICKRSEPTHGKPWHVDHCHKTKKVRGILCGYCNSMLGFAFDSAASLEAAIEYLRRFA